MPWMPVAGIAGLRAGRCLTRTHKHTSRVANTADVPATMSPDSPPSPMTMCVEDELVVSVEDWESCWCSALAGKSAWFSSSV